MTLSVHENVSKGVKRDQQLFDLKIDPCMASSTLGRARKVALDEMFFSSKEDACKEEDI